MYFTFLFNLVFVIAKTARIELVTDAKLDKYLVQKVNSRRRSKRKHVVLSKNRSRTLVLV
uniref:Uncharacterized protein n=1 Tax=Anguilla anguilla TaxID=7936 RepID=A0A0E9XV99_ANGAN